jgi:RNA polymerase sigma factor for flagellar operon FliA
VHHAVATVAARLPRHVAWDDLESAGMLGLTEATRTFDPTRGVPFEVYATRRIRGALLDELRTMDWATRSVRAKARLVEERTQSLAGRLRRQPTRAEVGESLGMAGDELRRLAEDVARATVVHYEAIGLESEEPDSVLPTVPCEPELALLEGERREQLHRAIRALPERHRVVVNGWFFEDRLMLDIAGELGITESRVSQLRSEALVLLRDGMEAQQGDVPATVGEERGARRRAAYRRALRAA